MPTRPPLVQPKVASVGVVVLLAPGTASPLATSIGVALPVSTTLVCNVNSLGTLPKPCALISVKLWAADVAVGLNIGVFVLPSIRTRLALAAPGKIVPAADNDTAPTVVARSSDANFMEISLLPSNGRRRANAIRPHRSRRIFWTSRPCQLSPLNNRALGVKP